MLSGILSFTSGFVDVTADLHKVIKQRDKTNNEVTKIERVVNVPMLVSHPP